MTLKEVFRSDDYCPAWIEAARPCGSPFFMTQQPCAMHIHAACCSQLISLNFNRLERFYCIRPTVWRRGGGPVDLRYQPKIYVKNPSDRLAPNATLRGGGREAPTGSCGLLLLSATLQTLKLPNWPENLSYRLAVTFCNNSIFYIKKRASYTPHG